jgi:hypothetical protein
MVVMGALRCVLGLVEGVGCSRVSGRDGAAGGAGG